MLHSLVSHTVPNTLGYALLHEILYMECMLVGAVVIMQ